MVEGAWLGGVCTGLARHLGWPLMAVRIAFVALATFQFVGVIAYGALWLLLPPESTLKAPGLESAAEQVCGTKASRSGGSTGGCCWHW